MLTTLKPTPLTKDCCNLILALLPADPVKLHETLNNLGPILNTDIHDTIALTKRVSNPGAKPVFDDKHELALWYDNNIQMPRYLLALVEALQIVEFPSDLEIQLSFDPSEVLNRAQSVVNSHVTAQKNHGLTFS
jgi:hypothetical protein